MNINVIYNTEFVPNEDIKNLTTYKNKGYIKGAFYPKNERELTNTFLFLKKYKIPFFIVGNGSNLLISEKTDSIALSIKKLKQSLKIVDNSLYVSASLPLSKIYQNCLKRKLGGFECLAHIPATIGGAIRMNASAFGQSVFDHLEYVKIFKQGKIRQLNKNQIKFSYHKTNLDDCVILSAKFNLNKQKMCEIKRNFSNFLIRRQQCQPKGFSCGSIFKNPPLHSAGQLIENCGLKGLRYGNAQISPVHANFIINNGNATFDEVYYLINLAEVCVLKKFGIALEKEVEIIN